MDWAEDRLASAERGDNPTVLRRLRTSWAVIGDTQHLPGYSLLLYAGAADQLTDLDPPDRAAFLLDLTLLGEAVATACAAADPGFSRVNYEILGNTWPHLHGHVHPRYRWEPDAYRRGPVWLYPDRRDARYALAPRHSELRALISEELDRIAATAYQ